MGFSRLPHRARKTRETRRARNSASHNEDERGTSERGLSNKHNGKLLIFQRSQRGAQHSAHTSKEREREREKTPA